MLVFTNREKSAVLLDIICRETSPEDRMRRIMSLDFEYRNAEVCDVELPVGNDAAAAAAELERMIGPAAHKKHRAKNAKKTQK